MSYCATRALNERERLHIALSPVSGGCWSSCFCGETFSGMGKLKDLSTSGDDSCEKRSPSSRSCNGSSVLGVVF